MNILISTFRENVTKCSLAHDHVTFTRCTSANTNLSDHGDPESEEEEAEPGGELAAYGAELLRPHVHYPRHQRLHQAELGVDPDSLHVQYRKQSTDVVN